VDGSVASFDEHHVSGKVLPTPTAFTGPDPGIPPPGLSLGHFPWLPFPLKRKKSANDINFGFGYRLGIRLSGIYDQVAVPGEGQMTMTPSPYTHAEPSLS